MSTIPPPPVFDDDPGRVRLTVLDVRTAMHGGIYGTCCMCQFGVVRWFDLSEVAAPPVIDADGTLTDQIALHDRCAHDLVTHWWTLVEGPGDDEPPLPGDAGAIPAPSADSVTWSRTTATADRVARMGGMYSR